jgi:TP901 family phage tail tape measure protein
MDKFALKANKAAKALSATTTEYSNAALIYYQQGLSDEEVLKRTDTTIKLANVSRQSAETVSEWMTAIWNNFDNGTRSLESYADTITALGAATASSADEIAEGLEKFSAIAETVGLSYDYATAALATVTSQTRQSADVVGTAFKTLFARLEGLKLGETLEDGVTLNQYSEGLAAVGINILNANGELKDMDTILD